MTRKQIDQSREIRLWLGQILIPAAGILLAFPEVREKAKEKVLQARDKTRDLFKKGKSKKDPQVVYVYQPVDMHKHCGES